jgi:hypothetical protein
MRFPQGRKRALTLSYDDGVEQDARLIEILNRFGLKATFNLNSGLFAPDGTVYPKGTIHRRLTLSAAKTLYADGPHEVAAHTASHPFLEALPPALALREILTDRAALENIFGVPVCGMAYPCGTHSDAVVSRLEAAGIRYARTTRAHKGFSLPADWLRLEATCHHKDPELMPLTERFLQSEPRGNPLLFYLWGHSYEFEADDNWNVIEAFAEKVGGRDDVWYATNIEAYDYIKAWEAMRFSADGELAQNLSSQTVWLCAGGETISVAAGEIKRIGDAK